MQGQQILVSLGAAIAVATLSACGGGGSDTPSSDDVVVSGTLVSPPLDADVGALLDTHWRSLLRMTDECPAVPSGYAPLANASISFVDASGISLGENFISDACGSFAASAPSGAVGIIAEAPGFRPLQAQTEVFVGNGSTGVASTIADTATYEIGALQIVDNNTLAFSVTDSQSRRSVLGIPASAFNIVLDGASQAPESVVNASSTINDQAATVVMTLDASGSMSTTAFTDDDGTRYSRNQLATIAAHQFISQKADDDSVALSIFSSRVFFLDQETLDDELPIEASDGQPLVYSLSEDGFTNDGARLRFPIDAYNRDSALYRGESGDPLHPDTPVDFELATRYPFGGSTHLYESILDALDRLALRASARPVVVAMTDGQDNGPGDEDDAIERARSLGIPVYTIGMDSDSASDDLQRVADETGGAFFNVNSTEIGDAFESIQTGIVFQYLASVPDGALDSVFTVGLNLDFNGLAADRTLVVTP